MFTSLLKFNFLFLFSFLSNSLHAAMFLNPPGEPSNNFDGEYRFSHICFKKDGSQQQGNKYDGSKFIIIKGISQIIEMVLDVIQFLRIQELIKTVKY